MPRQGHATARPAGAQVAEKELVQYAPADFSPRQALPRAYEANRRAAIEGIIDADPVAACVLDIMTQRSSWTGSAADLLWAGAVRSSDGISRGRIGWPKPVRRSDVEHPA